MCHSRPRTAQKCSEYVFSSQATTEHRLTTTKQSKIYTLILAEIARFAWFDTQKPQTEGSNTRRKPKHSVKELLGTPINFMTVSVYFFIRGYNIIRGKRTFLRFFCLEFRLQRNQSLKSILRIQLKAITASCSIVP